ncbi:NifB/NifX family molybdenum-iron cluster-binding protein [Pseudomonas panipatensis]|uniref:Dinitrogenase iron-molybdenum cofactor n=1 Tax=Pseudomonas panipatensis TaxID=428992 RepID=A0A1G8MMR3_9PSED|nr:NifB/NifX family molybdenum-iron cluster-binding protein [Pseudomonas panipatensis]SDI69194.1 Dinitrogenase iron-molybdenum cofactor [Pseudomonas panipatensis]SMP77540.1 Dinitrogenase iron-molybdenum cofactor [Pseudomonas panipatensis]
MTLIAVASQNATTVTAHAGRCRRFLLFGRHGHRVLDEIELAPEQILQLASLDERHPLAQIRVLISRGIGEHLSRRLGKRGVDVYLTHLASPELAVRSYLGGVPSSLEPRASRCHCGQPD